MREGQDKMDVEQSDEKSTDDGPRNEVDRFREVAQERLEPYVTDRGQEGQRAVFRSGRVCNREKTRDVRRMSSPIAESQIPQVGAPLTSSVNSIVQ